MPTYCNELVVGGQVKFSLKNDTVTDPSHIMAGYVGHLADGRQVTGTGQGGPSATRHTIHFEFIDETTQDVYLYYDSAFIAEAIRATAPSTYGGKQVSLAQLDGVTWYEPAPIPLNVELIDFTKVTNGVFIGDDGLEHANEWMQTSDYTPIDPIMTFEYIGYMWYYMGIYDANKNVIDAVYLYADKDSEDQNGSAHGTLTPAKMPPEAAYVRLSSVTGGDSRVLSLIRIA